MVGIELENIRVIKLKAGHDGWRTMNEEKDICLFFVDYHGNLVSDTDNPELGILAFRTFQEYISPKRHCYRYIDCNLEEPSLIEEGIVVDFGDVFPEYPNRRVSLSCESLGVGPYEPFKMFVGISPGAVYAEGRPDLTQIACIAETHKGCGFCEIVGRQTGDSSAPHAAFSIDGCNLLAAYIFKPPLTEGDTVPCSEYNDAFFRIVKPLQDEYSAEVHRQLYGNSAKNNLSGNAKFN